MMRAPARLALYAAALVAIFGSAYVVAGAVVPEEAARDVPTVPTPSIPPDPAEEDSHDDH